MDKYRAFASVFIPAARAHGHSTFVMQTVRVAASTLAPASDWRKRVVGRRNYAAQFGRARTRQVNVVLPASAPRLLAMVSGRLGHCSKRTLLMDLVENCAAPRKASACFTPSLLACLTSRPSMLVAPNCSA